MAEPMRPRSNASAIIPTAAPTPNSADNVPTIDAPPPSASAIDGVSVMDGSDTMPTVVTASRASSSGRSPNTYRTAARTR